MQSDIFFYLVILFLLISNLWCVKAIIRLQEKIKASEKGQEE